jgi:hypothetical protein
METSVISILNNSRLVTFRLELDIKVANFEGARKDSSQFKVMISEGSEFKGSSIYYHIFYEPYSTFRLTVLRNLSSFVTSYNCTHGIGRGTR